MRFLTRPRSPAMKRPATARDRNINLNLEGLPLEQRERRVPARRAQSAHPLGRSPSTVTPKPPAEPRTLVKRPQTASVPMTYTKHTDSKKTEILSVQPFANSDELYPNKSALTTYHHGFKSIWPIGRRINQIHSTKPFNGQEMNSYSRAIERRQLPFKGNHNIVVHQLNPTEKTPEQKCLIVKKQILNGDNLKPAKSV